MAPKKEPKEKNQNIQVAVRCRPMSATEKRQGSFKVVDVHPDKKEISIKEKSVAAAPSKTFSYDRVFGPNAKQVEVYKSVVAPMLDEVLMGYNCTVFAYGQTGTGKTFTMEGGESLEESIATWESDPLAGIIPRAMHHLFDRLQMQVQENNIEFSVRVSYLEIYNEELIDLLGGMDLHSLRLKIYEDVSRKGSCVIQGLEDVVVHNKNEVYTILEQGRAKRQTAATLMNAHSSRSHTVFMVTIHIKENSLEGEELLKTGKLNLVDLAGCECIGRSGAVNQRAREAGSINQSLLTLGRVITALVEHAPHVPYRESKLTRLLQDSLGGRTKTCIIATISPASCNMEVPSHDRISDIKLYESENELKCKNPLYDFKEALRETLSTLDYAFRAKNITNRPEINQKLTKKALLKEYTEELERLRKDLQAARDKNGIFLAEDNYNDMLTKLTQRKDLINELEEKIKLLTDDMEKLNEMFSETKDQLAETADRLEFTERTLSDTKMTLGKTKCALFHTRMDRDEQQYLVTEHSKAEDRLHGEATQLLGTVEDATSDVSGLHAKLDRKRRVETHNSACQQSFQERFSSCVSGMQERVAALGREHKARCHTHTQQLADALTTRDTEIQQLCSMLSGMVDALKQKMDQTEVLQQQGAETNAAWAQHLSHSTQHTKDEEVGSLDGFLKATFLPAVTETLDKLSSEASVLTKLTHLQQTQMKAEQTLVEEMTRLQQNGLHELRKQIASHSCHQMEALDRHAECSSRLITSQASLSESVKQELMADISRLVDASFLRQQQQLNASITQLQEELSTTKSNVSQFSDVAHSVIDCTQSQAQKDLSTYKETSTQNCSERSAQINQLVSLTDGCQRLQQEFPAQLTQFVEQRKQIWQQTQESTNEQLEQLKKCNEEAVHAHRQLSQNVVTECEGSVEEIRSTTRRQHQQFADAVSSMQNAQQTQAHNICDWSDSMTSDLQARDADVQTFLTEDLKKDVPTGTTPQRKEFRYPRVLTRMNKHDELLKAFREEWLVQEAANTPVPAEDTCDNIKELSLESAGEGLSATDVLSNASQTSDNDSALSSSCSSLSHNEKDTNILTEFKENAAPPVAKSMQPPAEPRPRFPSKTRTQQRNKSPTPKKNTAQKSGNTPKSRTRLPLKITQNY